MAPISPTIMVGVVVFLIIKYFKSILTYVQLSKTMSAVHGEKPHWLAGNMIRDRYESGINAMIASMKEFPRFQRRWYGIFRGGISFYDPLLCNNILERHRVKSNVYNLVVNMLGDGLLTNHGRKWRHYRKMLNPAFHNNMMKSYMEIFNRTSMGFVERLKDKNEFRVKIECSQMAVDTITGVIHTNNSFDEEQSKEYLKAANDIAGVFADRVSTPILYSDMLFSMSEINKTLEESKRILAEQSRRSIEICRKKLTKNCKPSGMLEILVSAKNENGDPLSDDEINNQLNVFMFAGHETTASALGWALYLLSLHQEHQDKCREEIKTVLKENDQVSWEDVSKLNYTTMCIKETLRLYPPAAIISRKLLEDTNVDVLLGEEYKDLSLPKESFLWVNILRLHRNPELWKDPSHYNPLRFTQENNSKRAPNSFIPFSSGQRNCIGQNFAMTEMKVALALLLNSYKFCLHEDYPKPKLQMMITLRQDEDFMLKIENL